LLSYIFSFFNFFLENFYWTWQSCNWCDIGDDIDIHVLLDVLSDIGVIIVYRVSALVWYLMTVAVIYISSHRYHSEAYTKKRRWKKFWAGQYWVRGLGMEITLHKRKKVPKGFAIDQNQNSVLFKSLDLTLADLIFFLENLFFLFSNYLIHHWNWFFFLMILLFPSIFFFLIT